MNDWGNDGLRTLVFGYKEVSKEHFEKWKNLWDRARGDQVEISKRKAKQPNQISELEELMEDQIHLQGATANEDKLQPAVPETIANLGRAEINVRAAATGCCCCTTTTTTTTTITIPPRLASMR